MRSAFCVRRWRFWQSSCEIGLLRAALEILAVKLCKGKMEPQALQRMRDSVEQMRQAGSDLYHQAQLDNSFHSCIVEQAGFHKLERIWKSMDTSNVAEQAGFHKLERIWKSMDTSNVAVFAAVEKQDILRCAQRHRELLAAYETQDEEKIIRALQKHYDVGANEDDRKQDERPFNEILRFFEGTPA